MKKKRIFGTVLAVLLAALMAFTLMACSSSKKTEKTTAAEETTTEATNEKETKEKETTTKKSSKEKETTKKDSKEKETTEKETEKETKTEETTANSAKEGAEVQASEGNMYCVAQDGVNVRTGYSTDDSIIGTLHYGDQVQITGTVVKDGNDFGWLQVNYNGQPAYVSADYFSVEQPAGERMDSNDYAAACQNLLLSDLGEGNYIVSSELRNGIGQWYPYDYCYVGVQDANGNITYYYATPEWYHTQEEIDIMNATDAEQKAENGEGVGEPVDDFERLCREIAVQTDGGNSVVISSELRHDGIGDWLEGDYYYIGVQDPEGNVTYYYCRTDWALTEDEIGNR